MLGDMTQGGASARSAKQRLSSPSPPPLLASASAASAASTASDDFEVVDYNEGFDGGDGETKMGGSSTRSSSSFSSSPSPSRGSHHRRTVTSIQGESAEAGLRERTLQNITSFTLRDPTP